MPRYPFANIHLDEEVGPPPGKERHHARGDRPFHEAEGQLSGDKGGGDLEEEREKGPISSNPRREFDRRSEVRRPVSGNARDKSRPHKVYPANPQGLKDAETGK